MAMLNNQMVVRKKYDFFKVHTTKTGSFPIVWDDQTYPAW